MRITEATITKFGWHFFKKMSTKYGGDTTINELRVINQVYACHSEERTTGVMELSRKLDIPKSTVSRAVFSLLVRGWLAEEPHEEDGRRREVTLGPVALERREADWRDCIDWMVEFSE